METTDPQLADVAIVGYGPVGQSLAIMLGNMGWKTVVIEKQQQIYPLPRACHFDHEAMRIFQSMGIAGSIEASSVPAREYKLLKSDGSLLASLPRDWESPSGWEASYHFYQPDIEAVLDRAARSTPNVSVRPGVTALQVEDHGGYARVSTTGEAGGPGRIDARYVIGADGANSIVRSQSGIGFQDLGFEATWLVADVLVKEGHEVPRIPDTAQVCDPEQPTHMAWLGGRHLRWEFMLVGNQTPESVENPEYIWPRLARWVSPEDAELVRYTAYTFRSLVAESFNKGRVLLAGDAAHLMPPFMGQGMVSGLRDAATLTWILDLVLKGTASGELLDSYTSSRSPHVMEYIHESVRVGRLVCETDPEKARLRDEQMTDAGQTPDPFQPAVGSIFQTGPLAGHLSVQPRVGTEDGKLLDDVVGPGFKLLTTDRQDLDGLSDGARAVIGHAGVRTILLHAAADEVAAPDSGEESPAAVLTEQGTKFLDWTRNHAVTSVLVRPDGYVYGAVTGFGPLSSLLENLREDLHLTANPGMAAALKVSASAA